MCRPPGLCSFSQLPEPLKCLSGDSGLKLPRPNGPWRPRCAHHWPPPSLGARDSALQPPPTASDPAPSGHSCFLSEHPKRHPGSRAANSGQIRGCLTPWHFYLGPRWLIPQALSRPKPSPPSHISGPQDSVPASLSTSQSVDRTAPASQKPRRPACCQPSPPLLLGPFAPPFPADARRGHSSEAATCPISASQMSPIRGQWLAASLVAATGSLKERRGRRGPPRKQEAQGRSSGGGEPRHAGLSLSSQACTREPHMVA